MANTYHQVYIQTIFAVKHREARLKTEWKNQLYDIVGNLIKESNCSPKIINGTDDHIHCLIGLNPKISISDMMQTIKGKSSKYINDHRFTHTQFEWQKGYGVFSYGQSQINSVYKYILNQEEHHKKISFREEYMGFLKKFRIDFDEKYIFDDLGNE